MLHSRVAVRVRSRRLFACASLIAVPLVDFTGTAPGGRTAMRASRTLRAQLDHQAGGIHAKGAHLVSNDSTFVVKGVQIVGFVAPSRLLSGQYAAARAHFGPTELAAAKSFGANLLRFQVSQVGLDPKSTQYSAAYVRELHQAVDTALSWGFRIIISLQHQGPSGSREVQPLPSENTLRAWRTIAPLWASDARVMYELYNEPGLPARGPDWRLWLDGGRLTENPGGVVVGMQRLINEIRSLGAKNVIIVPGLATEHTLQDVPLPHDPIQNLAFGIHSPPWNGGPAGWMHNFGYLAKTKPVIVTEWAASGRNRGCTPDLPAQAIAFVQFLKRRDIGVVGFSFDIPGTIVRDWDYQPTTFRNFQCARKGRRAVGGQGELLHRYFTGQPVDSAKPLSQ